MAIKVADQWSILFLLLLSFFVRIPFISYPESAVFDEGAYATFLSNDVQRIRYFEIHPPLARLTYAALYHGNATSVPLFNKANTVNKPFEDFPYVPGRKMSVILGSVLPILVFVITRMLSIPTRFSVVPGIAAALDPLLVVYARTLLPDTVLWVCGLLSVVCGLLVFRLRSVSWQFVAVILAGVCIGLATSVKWTGAAFGFVFVCGLCVYYPHWRRGIVYGLIAGIVSVITYIGVWQYYLNLFSPGVVDPQRSFYEHLADDISFSTPVTFVEAARFAVTHAIRAREIQQNEQFMNKVIAHGYPERWPVAFDRMAVWQSQDKERHIKLSGNLPAYILSTFALLYILAVCLYRLFKKEVHALSHHYAFVLSSYAVLYGSVVLFSWVRPMFLYHYVPAYFVALLGLSVVLYEYAAAAPRHGRVLYRAALILISAFFVIQSVYVYGY